MSEQMFALAPQNLSFPPYHNVLSTKQLYVSHQSTKYTLL